MIRRERRANPASRWTACLLLPLALACASTGSEDPADASRSGTTEPTPAENLAVMGVDPDADLADTLALPPVSAEPPEEHQLLLDAVFSVYYHALEVGDPLFTEARRSGGPLEIEDAVEVLVTSGDPDARFWRHRSIEMLTAAKAAGEPDPDRFDAEIEDLLEPEATTGERLPTAHYFALVDEEFGSEDPPDTAREMHTTAAAALTSAVGGVPGCATRNLEKDVETGSDDVVRAWVSIEVQRNIDDVARAIDPQSWSACMPLVFPHSFIASPGVNGSYPSNPDGSAHPLPDPPPVGSTWSGIFYEHFRVEFMSWFRNLIAADAQHTPGESYSLRYMLYRSNQSRVIGSGVRPGGISVDEGSASIVPAGTPGWSTYTGTKAIQLQERFPLYSAKELNLFAHVGLEMMMSGMSLWVCCDVPPSAP